MTIKDSATLAYTKFKTRKARSVLTIIGSSFLMSILLFLTIAGTGLKNSVVGKVTTPLQSENIVVEYYGAVLGEVPIDDTKNLLDESKRLHKENIAKSGVNAKEVYSSILLTQGGTIANAELEQLPNNSGGGFYFGSYLEATSDQIMKPFLSEGQNFDWSKDQAVPVIVNMQLIEQKYETELKNLKDAKKRVEKMSELRSIYLGKEQMLNLDYTVETKLPEGGTTVEPAGTPTKIKVKVVGFSPSSTSFFASIGLGQTLQSSVSIPLSVALQIPELSSALNTPPTYLYSSFASKEDRDKYFEYTNAQVQYGGATKVGDISESVDDFVDGLRSIFKWIVIIMLIFVTLPTMGTLGKVLTDSRRETGVFRAIGAKNRDITQIYVVYSIIMSSVAFVVSVLIASTVALLLTSSKGGQLSASLSEFSGNVGDVKVVLLGINIGHWAFLYGVLVLSAILGAALPVIRALRKDPITAMRDE